MKYTLASACLPAILDVAQDVYIVVEKDTLQVLEWNPAFTRMGCGKHLSQESIFLNQEPYATHFSAVKELIAIHTELLRAGSAPTDFSELPLRKNAHGQQGMSAKVIAYMEKDNAVLLHISEGNALGLPAQMTLQALERRDALLQATSRAAQELVSEDKDFERVMHRVLGTIGKATFVDRVYVWHLHDSPYPEDTRVYTSQIYEWCEEGGAAVPQQGNELTVNMVLEEIVPTWMDTFLAGKCINDHVKNMPLAERNQLEPQGIISMLTAPMTFRGKVWGFIGFANCHAEYLWSSSEEDILRTAGTLVCTAINSRRTNEALYHAQERFGHVAEATGDVIWSVDKKHNLTYISPRVKAVLGYEPEELVGKSFSAVLVNADEFIFMATPQNPIIRDVELRIYAKDGSIHWLRSSCKYSFAEDGTLLYGFGSSADFTHMHDVQDELKVANKELEEANKIAHELADSAHRANAIKGHFIANVSHEIRTPMNAIVGITHLLKHTELNLKQEEYIQTIDDSSVALLGIINDLLDFSKIQDGKMIVEEHSFTMQSIVDDVTKTARHWIDEDKLSFSFTVDPQVAPNYVGDVIRLNQVLTSLTTNAIKFTHEGSIHIKTRVECDSNESTLLHFSVQDTGIGISEEQMGMLFEGFTQADTSSTRRYGGIGLGLALCKSLITLMGGELWCESTQGVGTTFHFTCRLKKKQEKSERTTKLLNEIHIVAAFPHAQSFAALQDTLSPLGFLRVTFAEDTLSLKKHIDGLTTPDLIIIHEEFSDISFVGNALEKNDAYFNAIPIIYYAQSTKPDFTHVCTVVDSLGASVLYDSFVNILGTKFEPNTALCQQGFEDLLRTQFSGKNVLLVEDNEVNQMIAQTILEEVGLVVTIANDGVEGCELMYKEKFDLVIMDVQMPKMDGLSAARKLREDSQFAHIPIIAMTAHAMDEDREKSFQAGMNDHTTKPIDTANLFKVLYYWLSKVDSGTALK